MNNDNKGCKKIKITMSKYNHFFEYGTYDRSKLGHILSKEKYEEIIRNANKILSDCWDKKLKYEKLSKHKFIYICSILTAIIFFIYFILFLESPKKENGKTLKIFGIIFALLGLFLILLIEINLLTKPINKGKQFSEFYDTCLLQYCEEVNKKLDTNAMFYFSAIDKSLYCITNLNSNSQKISEKDSSYENSISPDNNCIISNDNHKSGLVDIISNINNINNIKNEYTKRNSLLLNKNEESSIRGSLIIYNKPNENNINKISNLGL